MRTRLQGLCRPSEAGNGDESLVDIEVVADATHLRRIRIEYIGAHPLAPAPAVVVTADMNMTDRSDCSWVTQKV